MALTDQVHTLRFPLPHEVVFDANTVLRAPLYLSGALVVATSGTISVYDETGTAVVSAQAVTITGSIATYTVTANTFASTKVNEVLRVVWTVNHAGGTVIGENDGIVVRRLLYPVITDADLFRRISALDPGGSSVITDKTNYQDAIDEAWCELIGDLIGKGFRGAWIRSPSSLRKAHLALTLSYVFEDLASRLTTAYREIAQDHRAAYVGAMNELTVLSDRDGDGEIDQPRRRQGVTPSVVFLGGRGGA